MAPLLPTSAPATSPPTTLFPPLSALSSVTAHGPLNSASTANALTTVCPPLASANSPMSSGSAHGPAIQTAGQQLEDRSIQSVSSNTLPKRVTPSGVNATCGFIEGIGCGDKSYGTYLTKYLPRTHIHVVLRHAEASRLTPANPRAKRGHAALSASHPRLDVSSMNIHVLFAHFSLTSCHLGGGDLTWNRLLVVCRSTASKFQLPFLSFCFFSPANWGRQGTDGDSHPNVFDNECPLACPQTRSDWFSEVECWYRTTVGCWASSASACPTRTSQGPRRASE